MAKLPRGVPKSEEQAIALAFRIVSQHQAIERIARTCKSFVAILQTKIKRRQKEASERKARRGSLVFRMMERLEKWAIANRENLTNKGRRKSGPLGEGVVIGWELYTSALKIHDVDILAAFLEGIGKEGKECVSSKPVIDKKALRQLLKKRPELLAQMPGVTRRQLECFYLQHGGGRVRALGEVDIDDDNEEE